MAYYEHLPIYKKAMETAVYVERELVDVDGVEVMHVQRYAARYALINLEP